MKATRFLIAMGVGILSVLAASLPTLADTTSDALGNARDATAIYADPTAALASGYDLLTDANDIACIDMPGQGAMGVHYVKGALVQSGVIDAARPQALVYEVGADGRLRLVALEYVVLKSTWDATHTTPPSLFGQQFMLTPVGNRYGLPDFYSLHAWIWKRNPSGAFNPWNPTVRCAAPLRAEDGQRIDPSGADNSGTGHVHLMRSMATDAASTIDAPQADW